MNIRDFTLLGTIGRGGFANVFVAKKNDGVDKDNIYAIKVSDKAHLEDNQHLRRWCKQEREVINPVPFIKQ